MSTLLLETIHQDAMNLLESHGPVHLAGSPDEIGPDVNLEQVQAIVTRGRGRITAELMDRCPHLEVIARCGAGLDNIDLEAARVRSIPVVYAPGKTARSVAEHTLMFMLCLARDLPALANQVRSGNWGIRSSYCGFELRGKTLGIVGMGAIGRRVAHLAQSFGMHVIYWNRSALSLPYTSSTLENLFQQADFISLHTALTAETRHLVGHLELGWMKPQAFLINTSRGGLVDEAALLDALSKQQLAGYAADLLAMDPPPSDHPLLHHPRTLITPHSAVLTDTTYREICLSTAQNVVRLLINEQPDPGSVYA